MRPPSVRDPRAFFDVFTVTIVAVGLMAAVLYVADSPLVRAETAAFVALVFAWDVWAIFRILERAKPGR